ncbi:MAG: AzlD domain-containing protein [Denitrovibrio sp.]|nr:MAG: AzlD domain-containing protein [Denitrovibrio sp.]
MTATSFFTILGMCVATYITRASGIFIASRFNMTPRFKAALSGIPIAIIISIIIPNILSGGAAEYISSAIVVVLAYKRLNLVLCLGVGIAAVNVFRYFL